MSGADLARDTRAAFGRHDLGDRETLERLATIYPAAAYHFDGHPSRPRPQRRFREQPWRCARCGQWQITEHRTTYADHDSGGAWHWVDVDDPVPASPSATTESEDS